MAGIAGVSDVDTSLQASVPRLDVVVDRKAAAAAGLTEAQIGQTVAGPFRSAPAGESPSTAPARTSSSRSAPPRPTRPRCGPCR